VSKRAFNALDAHVWRLVYKWARLTDSNKSTRWVNARYFGLFNPARRDKWVFGSRETGFYTRQAIRRGTFTSVPDVIGAIRTFIDAYNQRCQPFTWTKTADQILTKADRQRRRPA
jgi:hypothetical protein